MSLICKCLRITCKYASDLSTIDLQCIRFHVHNPHDFIPHTTVLDIPNNTTQPANSHAAQNIGGLESESYNCLKPKNKCSIKLLA